MTLEDEKYMLLTSYRKDGTGVSTPVWVVALDDGTYGFWTSSGSGKAKRLAHTDRVSVQPCDARGRVKPGSTVTEATARVVEGDEYRAISARVKAKYGFMTTLSKFLGEVVGFVKRKQIPYGDIGVVVTPAV